jgi:hypothetical protein
MNGKGAKSKKLHEVTGAASFIKLLNQNLNFHLGFEQIFERFTPSDQFGFAIVD